MMALAKLLGAETAAQADGSQVRWRSAERPAAALCGQGQGVHLHLPGRRARARSDLFDPKPKLRRTDGQPLPESLTKKVRFAFIKKETARLLGSPRKFTQHGAERHGVQRLLAASALVRRRHLHGPLDAHGSVQPSSGAIDCSTADGAFFGLPTAGRVAHLGLGSESQNLPGYVVLSAGAAPAAERRCGRADFCRRCMQGVLFRNQGEPVLNLTNPAGLPAELQRPGLDALRDINSALTRVWAIRRSPAASPATNWRSACSRRRRS